MNTKEIGKLFAELRKNAGYTQASLAKTLFVTDKAVSKWERGLCAPDSSLLPQLSMLLDVDIELLINGNKSYGEQRCGEQKWVGEIRCEVIERNIAGKPLIHYLLSYFMLMGITDIYIKTENKEYIKNLCLDKYGLNIYFFPVSDRASVVIYDNFLLFGANVTRYFQSFMQSGKNIIPIVDGKEVPILFTNHPSFSVDWHRENSEKKILTRGMVFLPLNEDAESFIKIYEKNSGHKISDLMEVAKNRNLI